MTGLIFTINRHLSGRELLKNALPEYHKVLSTKLQTLLLAVLRKVAIEVNGQLI